jgi:hypothetical protein
MGQSSYRYYGANATGPGAVSTRRGRGGSGQGLRAEPERRAVNRICGFRFHAMTRRMSDASREACAWQARSLPPRSACKWTSWATAMLSGLGSKAFGVRKR